MEYMIICKPENWPEEYKNFVSKLPKYEFPSCVAHIPSNFSDTHYHYVTTQVCEES